MGDGEWAAASTEVKRAEQSPLSFHGSRRVTLSHSFFMLIQWYELPRGDVAPRDVLAMLLRQIQYRYDLGVSDRTDFTPYLGDPYGTIHGPYLADALTPEAFTEVTAHQADQLLDDWWAPVEEEADFMRARIEQLAEVRQGLVTPLLQRSRTWHLAEDPVMRHDWGGVFDDVLELVAFDPLHEELVVITAAGD